MTYDRDNWAWSRFVEELWAETTRSPPPPRNVALRMGDGDECAFLGTGLRHEGWPERNEPGGRIIWCTVERRDLSERLGDVTGVFDTEAEARDSLRTHPSPYAKTVERDMAVEPTASEAAVDAVWFENERGDS